MSPLLAHEDFCCTAQICVSIGGTVNMPRRRQRAVLLKGKDRALAPCYAASTALLGAGGPDEDLPSTARIHRCARRRGSMAACGSRATKVAASRSTDGIYRRRPGSAGPLCSISGGSSETRMDRGPQHQYRSSLGRV